MQPKRIGFLGLGTMGMGMARRLIGAGHTLSVFNRSRDKSEMLAGEGALAAESPRQAAQGCSVIISMVADDPASRAVWLGDQGAMEGAAKGAVLIECSTLTVPWVRELASVARSRGCTLVDAPVTGTKPHAANGELNFLVGTDEKTLETIRPILAVMSREIIHVGPTGAGATLKLINNCFCAVQAEALAEALAMIQRTGLDAGKAIPVLLNGAPGSPVVKTLTGRHLAGDYTPNFRLSLMAKDIGYAIDEGRGHDLPLPAAAAALGSFRQAISAGLGEQDFSAIIKQVMQLPTK